MPRKRWRKRVAILLFIVALVCGNIGLTLSNPASVKAENLYETRFLEMYKEIKDPANGYFSPEGIPYHSVETLMSEAPDYGHMTTSEAYSYWFWLETLYGYYTGDWSKLEAAWDNMEKYIIPINEGDGKEEQPSMGSYNASSPATYAPEHPYPDQYPSMLGGSVTAGRDPLDAELKSTYGNNQTYLMHWLLDVDDWYGFGNTLNPDHTTTYVNTFQRGEQESVWETITHPSQDDFTYGKTGEGFVSLFVKENQAPAKQWRYTAATDADARAVQVMYWAKQLGYNNQKYLDKAKKMGDYLRYGMYDKYFQKIGSAASGSPTPGNGKDASMYLLSWYTAWGGGLGTGGNWAWRIGSSHAHQAYQNPVAAYALSNSQAGLVPESPTAKTDWETSLKRQLEFYTWLQTAEGAVGGGATNSVGGSYKAYPSGVSQFYGLAYDEDPVYHDPPSNTWFGFQAWPLERVAEYYYILASRGDISSENFKMAKQVIQNWVDWALDYTFINKKPKTDSEGYYLDASGKRITGGDNPTVATTDDPGQYYIPGGQEWTGQPDTWNGFSNFTGNPNYHVITKNPTQDVGVLGSYVKLLTFFAAATKAETGNYTALGNQAKAAADQLLDIAWNFRDDKGIALDEPREDYYRYFEKEIYFPTGWTGKYGQGNTIPGNGGVPSDPAKGGNGVYISYAELRPEIKNDPQWKYLSDLYEKSFNKTTKKWENGVPTFKYHRFWSQVDIATAYAEYGRLIGSDKPQAPSAPTGLKAEAGDKQVKLIWNQTVGADSYTVKRATSQAGPFTPIKTGLTSPSYTDTGLTNGTTYYYVVSAVNDVGESANSSVVSARPSPVPAPGNFTLSATAGDASAELSWTESTGATSYDVLRATSSSGPFTEVKTGLTTTSYKDTGLTNGTTVWYKVRAVNASGSTESNTVSVKPDKPLANLVLQYRAADTNPGDNQIKPHFNLKNNGASSINLSDVTIRYWYTSDGSQAQSFHCDYAVVNCSNVKGSVVKMSSPVTGADNYLELSFSGGTLAANGQSGEIQTRINKADWSNYNESNDYSFDGTKTVFADWNKVTVYYKGSLVYGVEP